VIAVFYPNDSWKRKKKKGVLVHEQRHFDIVELFARKLRKQIQSGTYKDYNDLVEKIERYYDQTDRELDAYQDKYDRMTNHSRNSRRQAKWNSKVEMELDGLSDYKTNTFDVFYEATSAR
jgi:predicted secreted Zn-dependent protease